MVFESLFGKQKKQSLGDARAQQFKEAWLLANRSLLAAKQQNEGADTAIEEDSLLNKARQHMSDQKESFTADAHHLEQLTTKLLPVVEQIYAYANRFVNDADVSSAHNTTYQRILELVMAKAATSENVDKIPSPPDFSDEENEMLERVSRILAEFWKAD